MNNGGRNSNGRRWYEQWAGEHTKVVAATLILGTLVLLAPFITTLYLKASAQERSLAEYKLEVREKYVTYDEFCRTTDRVFAKLDEIYREVKFSENRERDEEPYH